MMIKKLISSIFKVFVLASLGLAQANAQTTTAGILPLAKTQFLDQNGNPLSSGKVYFYSPGTTTAKTTWQDINKLTPNLNPVVLDAGGRALIWGDGTYRQQVYDRNNNLIWDQVTSGTGTGSTTSSGDGLAVGSVLPWSGFIAPPQYMFAYGQSVSRSTYSKLLASLTQNATVTCSGGNNILNGFTDTTQIPIGAAVEASCLLTTGLVTAKTSTSVTLNVTANVNLVTLATVYPYGNGDASTTFNIPDYRGQTLVGRNNMGGVQYSGLTSTYYLTDPNSLGAPGGSQSHTLNVNELPSGITSSGNNLITVSPAGGGTGVPLTTAPANVVSANAVSGGGVVVPSSTSASWGGTSSFIGTNNIQVISTNTRDSPYSIVQPSKTINYIIKVTPDISVSLLFGVSDIAGMQGSIACGAGLICAGNTINTVPGSTTGIIGFFAGSSITLTGQCATNLTGSCTISYGPQTNIKTTSYAIVNTDCNKTIDISSTSLLTLTLPSTAGFPEGCLIPFKNSSSTRGVKLSGFPSGFTSPNMLWPLQAGQVQVVNGNWKVIVNPGRWKSPNGLVTYANVNLGNDTNDCLDINTTDGACKTMTQILRVNDKDYFDRSGTSSFPNSTLTVQLADNASGGNCTSLCYALVDIAYTAVGGEGRNSTLIQGNAATPSNVVIADAAAYGINVFRNSIEVQNLQFGQTNCAATPKANSGLSVIEGGVVFFQGTVNFGCVNQQQIIASSGGKVFGNARPINVTAGGGWFIYADDSGTEVNIQQSTVTFSNAPAYTSQTVTAFALSDVQLGSVTWTNGGTVTTPGTTNKWFCRGNSIIETDTGSGTSIPGSTGGSTNNGCTVF